MLSVNMDTDAVEFFDDGGDGKALSMPVALRLQGHLLRMHVVRILFLTDVALSLRCYWNPRVSIGAVLRPLSAKF